MELFILRQIRSLDLRKRQLKMSLGCKTHKRICAVTSKAFNGLVETFMNTEKMSIDDSLKHDH